MHGERGTRPQRGKASAVTASSEMPRAVHDSQECRRRPPPMPVLPAVQPPKPLNACPPNVQVQE